MTLIDRMTEASKHARVSADKAAMKDGARLLEAAYKALCDIEDACDLADPKYALAKIREIVGGALNVIGGLE